MQAAHLVGQRALLDDAVEQLLATLGRVELLGVEVCAERLARLVDLLAVGAVEFGARDLVSVDRCHIRAVVEEVAEALYPDEPEPRKHDQEQEEHHQALVIAEEIEHAEPKWLDKND